MLQYCSVIWFALYNVLCSAFNLQSSSFFLPFSIGWKMSSFQSFHSYSTSSLFFISVYGSEKQGAFIFSFCQFPFNSSWSLCIMSGSFPCLFLSAYSFVTPLISASQLWISCLITCKVSCGIFVQIFQPNTSLARLHRVLNFILPILILSLSYSHPF